MKPQNTLTPRSHTPGPWRVMPDPVWKGKHPCHDHRYITTNHDPEAYLTGWRFSDSDPEAQIIAQTTDSPQQAANARLIAAAPDLLEACRLAYDWQDKQTPIATPGRIEVRDRLRAAIDRAEGG